MGAAVKEWHLSNCVLAAENCFFLDMFLTVFRSDPKYLQITFSVKSHYSVVILPPAFYVLAINAV